MAKKTATRSKSKAAHKGKKKPVPFAGIAPVPGPPPTDIEITGIDFGYIAGGIGSPSVVAFSAHFHLSGTVSPPPVPAAQVSGYVYSLGQRYGAAAFQGHVVYEPCAQGGLAAIDTTGHKLRVRWRGRLHRGAVSVPAG